MLRFLHCRTANWPEHRLGKHVVRCVTADCTVRFNVSMASSSSGAKQVSAAAPVPFAGLRIFAAGSLSGAIAKTAVAPFDRTKLLMQVSRMYGWSTYDGGVRSTMVTIWRTEGLRGFFRGNSATVARIAPCTFTSNLFKT
jgi:Mitochondrial carrier protein